MKFGRAVKWAAWVFKWEEDNLGYSKIFNWEEFQTEFQKDFCPAHLDVAAINRLESTVYYQKNQSLGNYLDKFLDLVMEAGYIDPKMIVVKFRKGLDLQIQNTVETMAYGRLLDSSPNNWYEGAKNIDQNCMANEAFKISFWTPMPASIPTHLAPPSLSRILLSVPKIDLAQKNPVSFNCYRCDKPGHLAENCPHRHDIRTWSVEEVEMALMVKKDMIKEEDPVEIKEADPEDFVQSNKWRACPCCPHVIVSKYWQIYVIPKPLHQTCKNP